MIMTAPIRLSGLSCSLRITAESISAETGASDPFVKLVAVVSFRNVFELASQQIAVLFEEVYVPVARIRQDQ